MTKELTKDELLNCLRKELQAKFALESDHLQNAAFHAASHGVPDAANRFYIQADAHLIYLNVAQEVLDGFNSEGKTDD